LSAALAHALSLPNKIGLSADEYFVVQKAYAGWNRLAWVLLVQLLAMVAVAVFARRDGYVLWPVALAIICLLAAQALFWLYTYPANAATSNWTAIPQDWMRLRAQWEYSHAAGAALQLLAMCSLIFAALARTRA
jgi:hypothetical protein